MTVLFRSGFEQGVTLGAPQVAGGEWEQYLTGQDEGFPWTHPQMPKNRITYLVSGFRKLSNFAESRIETVKGHDGQPTRALFMVLKKQDPSKSDGTRCQYGIYPDGLPITQAYAKFRVKFQTNLATEILPAGLQRARQFMEWKESGSPRSDFRIGIYIARHPSYPELYWYTSAQFGDLQDSPEAWRIYSAAPVPVGEWAVFEVFWKLGVTDGRMWAAVNGVPIVDFTGQTMKDSGLYVWWPFKVYVGSQLTEQYGGKHIYQWVDDIEIHDERPA